MCVSYYEHAEMIVMEAEKRFRTTVCCVGFCQKILTVDDQVESIPWCGLEPCYVLMMKPCDKVLPVSNANLWGSFLAWSIKASRWGSINMDVSLKSYSQ